MLVCYCLHHDWREWMQGLNQYKGGVLMVSHDQHLIEATVNQLWVVENGTVTPFQGDFQEYKKKLRERMFKGP
jgi:ATP-binding cassette, subfamily F, member 3